MGNLQVLDLTKMKLPSLPSSLGLLTNLQALCLDRCELADIAVIGKLKNLVILSLFHSEMSQLPT
jgi:Leucine-rich repeat (LRR) protein